MFQIRFLVLVLAVVPILSAGKLPKPDRIAAPPTPEQAALIREGIALHDQHNYESAIAKYKQVLSENPSEVTALYELAFSYFQNKNYDDALATTQLGAQFKSERLPLFYELMGSSLDELGKGHEAIEILKDAIKQYPRIELLHYNLGVSLRRAGKNAEAKAALEIALKYEPNHASAHATLGAIYRDMGYRVPVILAYSRFLALEPESPRTMKVLPELQGLITGGVTRGKQSNQINMTISMTPKGLMDEGDFTSVEMAISISVAAELIKKPEEVKGKPSSFFERLVSIYVMIGESLGNSKPKGGFAATYYAPYFAALEKAGHMEAFVAQAWKAGNVDGASVWAAANEAKLEAFRAWSQTFQWPVK
jgi:tetratricopeptide (TPR) repeat protein